VSDLSDAAGARTLSDMSDATNTATLYGEYGNRQDEFGYLAPASQAEIIEHCHAIANLMNCAKDEVREIERAEVVTVTEGGFEITRGMVEDEIARSSAMRRDAVYSGPIPLVIGLNASTNMFGG
jgi:hypothetical protein